MIPNLSLATVTCIYRGEIERFRFAGLICLSAITAISGLFGNLHVYAQEREKIPVEPPRPMGIFERGEEKLPASGGSVMDFVSPLSNVDAVFELYVGQARTMTLKKPISDGKSVGVVAVGDPTVADFEVLPNPRMLRLLGKRAGLTDLSVVLGDDTILTFQVLVKYDLDLLKAEIQQRFPDASVRVSQLRENILLEGQVRSAVVAAQIEAIAESWLSRNGNSNRGGRTPSAGKGGDTAGMQAIEDRSSDGGAQAPGNQGAGNQGLGDQSSGDPAMPNGGAQGGGDGDAGFEVGNRSTAASQGGQGSIINLLYIPGVQQIMLQVRVAELNRTGMREVGADWIFASSNGNVGGTNISGNIVTAQGTTNGSGLSSAGTGNVMGSNGTAFGIFPSANFDVLLRILRKNSLLSILAEPNLVAMSGHEASFLAGGQFPVPVVNGLGGQVSIQYKDFGVQLSFTPTIIDDETIRLNVAPEVSTIDESLGTTLVPGGIPTPGINTRRVNTTVEMREGETLALAGLLEVAMDAQTTRIPGLGDLPYLGPFFSNTTHQRVEKELLVLVTPFFVAASPNCEQFSLPGQDIVEPNDLEFYLLGRIEGKTGRSFNTVQSWEDPWNCVDRLKLERQCLHGPVGFSR